MKLLQTPFGEFSLERQPVTQNQTLQAWDAGDELLIHELATLIQQANPSTALIVNDAFGALSCALNSQDVTCYSDSFLTQRALENNYALNKLGAPPVFVPSTEELSGHFDYVVIKIPKTLSLLEQQLICIQRVVSTTTKVIAAGMIKYLQKNHFLLLEKYIGPVTTSLARKKARLLFASPQGLQPVASPYPTSYEDSQTGLVLSNHANVFSREALDIGSRFLLEHIDKLPASSSIIDIGCGNGVLGIAAKKNLQSKSRSPVQVTFADESYMAIESSKTNYKNAFSTMEDAEFFTSDCFDQIPARKVDLVVCNPPFHQNNTVGDHIARKMIAGSRRYLAHGGHLWLIGNRHLNYHQIIKKQFGNVQVVASNRKFVLLCATR